MIADRDLYYGIVVVVLVVVLIIVFVVVVVALHWIPQVPAYMALAPPY